MLVKNLGSVCAILGAVLVISDARSVGTHSAIADLPPSVNSNAEPHSRTGDNAVQTDRRARAGFYYSPDDRTLLPIHPILETYDVQTLPQPRTDQVHQYSPLPSDSFPSSVENSEARIESEPASNAEEAEGRFFLWPVARIVSGSLGTGINTGSAYTGGSVNSGLATVGISVGTRNNFADRLRTLLGLRSLVSFSSPNTVLQPNPLVVRPISSPIGLFSSASITRSPPIKNYNAAIAPSIGSSSNGGIAFFKGINRL